MTECPICLELIDDSQYAVIDCDGENSKYHIHDLEEWFSTHKTGILTQSEINTYSIFKNGQHVETINIESHYSEFKVLMNDIAYLLDTDPYIPEDDDNEYWCC